MKKLLFTWLLAIGLQPATEGQQSTIDIEFVLLTTKARYRLGQKIPLTYYVVNRGPNGVFVYPPTRINFFFYDHFGGVGLEIVDVPTNRPVKYRKILKHSASGESMLPIEERVKAFYNFLSPGALIGHIDELDTEEGDLKPGDYEFRLRFSDHEPDRWSKEDRSGISHPVFSGAIHSNSLRISIVDK